MRLSKFIASSGYASRRKSDSLIENGFVIVINEVCRDLIKPVLNEVEYEEPRVGKIHGQMWKGKADIINHEEKLVIDLKTTSDIDRIQWSASAVF